MDLFLIRHSSVLHLSSTVTRIYARHLKATDVNFYESLNIVHR